MWRIIYLRLLADIISICEFNFPDFCSIEAKEKTRLDPVRVWLFLKRKLSLLFIDGDTSCGGVIFLPDKRDISIEVGEGRHRRDRK